MDFFVAARISVAANLCPIVSNTFFMDYFKAVLSREHVFCSTALIAGSVSMAAFPSFAFSFFSLPLISLGLWSPSNARWCFAIIRALASLKDFITKAAFWFMGPADSLGSLPAWWGITLPIGATVALHTHLNHQGPSVWKSNLGKANLNHSDWNVAEVKLCTDHGQRLVCAMTKVYTLSCS